MALEPRHAVLLLTVRTLVPATETALHPQLPPPLGRNVVCEHVDQVPSPLRDPELSELPSALRGIRAIPLNSLWLSFPEVEKHCWLALGVSA